MAFMRKEGKRNQVKIIGGQLRGRNIEFSESEGLRPTPARVRETLFNWLGQDLTGLTVLDLFAGSGVLGFESASRGALQIVMVDSQVSVVKNLQKNQEKIQQNNITIIKSDSMQYLRTLEQSWFDLVLLDPPYVFTHWEKLFLLLRPVLKQHAIIYLEASEKPLIDADFLELKSGKAGQSRQWLLQFQKFTNTSVID